MLYTNTQRGRFSSSLGWAEFRCSRKSCVMTVGARKRKFHRAALLNPTPNLHAEAGAAIGYSHYIHTLVRCNLIIGTVRLT